MTVLEKAERIMSLRFQIIELQYKLTRCAIEYNKWLELFSIYYSLSEMKDIEANSISKGLANSLINAKVLINSSNKDNFNEKKNYIINELNASKRVLRSSR